MSQPVQSMTKLTDGGRKSAGYKGDVGDCVIRAIAIATEQDYQTVYDEIARRVKGLRLLRERNRPVSRVVPPKVYKAYLAELDWEWVATMTIGSGCKVHLKAEELPSGRIICRVSKHLCAVIDGVVHDSHDPSRNGTRCVYGYFRKKP